MNIANEIENIFQEIPLEALNDIVMSSDFRVGSSEILQEDWCLCEEIVSKEYERNIKNLFEFWIEDEKCKNITVKNVISKCKDKKIALLLDKDSSIGVSYEYVNIKNFKTFKNFTHFIYSILIIKENVGYSYFKIVNF